MSTAPVVFSATGAIQSYRVPTTGTYVIEAAGAQGGAGENPGHKGARVRGMFALKRNDHLKIVAGTQGTPAEPPHQLCGGDGGSSMVWTGDADLPAPIKLMLSARGGKGGGPLAANATGKPAASGASPAVDSNGIVAHRGEVDPLTADALLTQWTGGTGSVTAGRSGGASRVDRGGYNAGSFRTTTPDAQLGDGYVSIAPVAVPSTSGSTAPQPSPSAPEEKPAAAASSGGSPMVPLPTPAGEPGTEAPSQTMLPRVTPRLKSWKTLLRRPRRP